MKRSLANFDQKDLFDGIVAVLEERFGRKLPSMGVVAGQAVSSAIFEVLGIDVKGRYKDLDIFIPHEAQKEFSNELRQDAKRRGAGLSSLADQLDKEPITFGRAPLYKNTSSTDIQIEKGPYDDIEIKSIGPNSYRLCSVYEGTEDNPINLVTYARQRHEMMPDLEDDFFDENLILGFDLNLTQSSINLATGKVTWSSAFDQFTFRPEIKVVNFTTPTTTAMRLLEKVENVEGATCDVDRNLELLAQARFLSKCYEDTQLTRSQVEYGDSNDQLKYIFGDSSKHEIEKKKGDLTIANLKIDDGDRHGLLPNNCYRTIVTYTLSKKNERQQKKFPGTKLHESKVKLWEKHEEALSRYFTLGNKTKIIKIDSVFTRTYVGRAGLEKEEIKSIDEFTITDVLPKHDYSHVWNEVFTKELAEHDCFFQIINSSPLRKSNAGLESLFESMDFMHSVAQCKTKESKAIKRIIHEAISPSVIDALKNIELYDNKASEIYKAMDKLAENERKYIADPFSNPSYEEDSEKFRMLKAKYDELRSKSSCEHEKIGVAQMAIRSVLSNGEDKKLRLLTPEKFSEYMKYVREERALSPLLSADSDHRENAFANYKHLRKKRRLDIMDEGLDPEISRQRPLKLLCLPRKELLSLMDENDKLLNSRGAVPMFDPVQKDGVGIIELCSRLQLKRQGSHEGHCVGGYVNAVRDGRSVILSLKSEGGKVSTAEIALINDDETLLPKADIRQHYGKFNNPADPVNDRVLRDWVAGFNRCINYVAQGGRVEKLPKYWQEAVSMIKVSRHHIISRATSNDEDGQPPEWVHSIDRYRARSYFDRTDKETNMKIRHEPEKMGFGNVQRQLPHMDLHQARNYIKFIEKRKNQLTPQMVAM